MTKLPDWYTKAIAAVERRLKHRLSEAVPLPDVPHTPRPTRRIHLGVDYGTAWSKMVYRDYEAPGAQQAHLVFADDGARRRGDFRYPSVVAMQRGRLYFGNEAKRCAATGDAIIWSSMKMKMALPREYFGRDIDLPCGFTADDLATLTVAYLLQHGTREAVAHCDAHRSTPRLAFTLGVPMTDLDNPDLCARFVSVARIAAAIEKHSSTGDFRDGLDPNDARKLLDAARADVAAKSEADPRKWIRSEFEAALLWPCRSPAVTAGLYAAVDLGAGTTSASFFNVTQDHQGGRWLNDGLAFFGASCKPPGADAIDMELARLSNEPDPARFRGRENTAIEELGAKCIEGILDAIAETYSIAFRRAYAKDRRLQMWEQFRVFLIGGGSEIATLRRAAWTPRRSNLRIVPELMDIAPPDDLVLGTVSEAELKFLLVAYGLSYADADVPGVLMPSDIEPMVVTRRQVEMDPDNPNEFRPVRR